MRRTNQFSTPKEIRANFKSVRDANRHAGVPVCGEHNGLLVDDSYRHVQIIGNTGEGKTECVVKPHVRDVLHQGENLILLNSKDDVCRELAGHVPAHYQKFYVNFDDPWDSPDSWNPWTYIAHLFHAADPHDRDRACAAAHHFWDGLLGSTSFTESFWPESATDYLKGLAFGLLELAEPAQVNLESIDSMMSHAEEKFGAYSYTRAFYDMLPEDSIAKTNLSCYVFAPSETRMSIFATARRGLALFGLSQGLRQLMMRDTLDIVHLDLERPFVFFITMPQESGIYANLAALLVEQLVSHLAAQANRRSDRRLPIRTHVVLEELGKVGRCIPSLPEHLATGRSMGLRFLLVLQSSQQLTEVYGQANAKNINACTDLNICFSTSCPDTLRQWSDLCGLTEETVDGVTRAVLLITPTELRGMDVGEALVVTKNLKFRTHLPFYYQLTALQETPEPVFPPKPAQMAEFLDFREFVKARKREEMMESQSALRGTATGPGKRNADGTPMRPPLLPVEADPEDLFLPSLDELNRLFERKRKEAEDSPKGFNVVVLDAGKKPREVAKTVSVLLSIPYREALERLNTKGTPITIPIKSRLAAEQAQRSLTQEGASVIIAPMLNPLP